MDEQTGAPGAEQMYVRVTNGLDEPFTDRYDGIPITIMPGKSQNLLPEQAAHFFGFFPGIERAQMFRHICKRQGWNTSDHVKQNPETRRTLAEQLFDKLQIEAVYFKLVEVNEPDDPAEPVPADPAPDMGGVTPRRQSRPRAAEA